MTLTEIARAVGGELADVPDPCAVVDQGAAFDSRQVEPGGLFVALPGTRSDGHAFAAAAVEQGAVAVLAARPVGVPAIVVDDVLAAFGRLGQHLAAHLSGTTVVAVTGSAGKTTTKDLIADLLAQAGPTVATEQSFNNEIGLPLTLTRATTGTHYLVLEMGARGLGHIRDLTRIAPPEISVVTNVGTAHLGEFGGQEQIAQAKGEIVEALPAGGLAVLNSDDPRVRAMANRTQARVVTYGTGDHATVRADDITAHPNGTHSYTLTTPEGQAPVRLQLIGRPQVHNSLAAAAVAREAGLDTTQIADLLSAATPQSRWRMEAHTRTDGLTILNDAYNASPDSVRSALESLALMAEMSAVPKRAVAVLGPMAELGAQTRALHKAVGAHAATALINQLVFVGDEAQWMHEAAASKGASSLHFPDQHTALAFLRSDLQPDDIVLVKAARSAGLEALALALQEESLPEDEQTEPAV
ncbi:UDP-N-acetylmuramoyl-tripeptide--D-alanyl-D-alanine ligase [Streptomyces sp. NPDC015350]|uniref:UDP-N-acetylmuramoyl-tripeptide--D-alanyl-D- alanine ligase n=1 Tax=Streptomyces sp. NPDC015350 TaxID=3364955 RepID=UPI0036F813EC